MKKPSNVLEFLKSHMVIKVDGGKNVLPFVKAKPPVIESSSDVNKKSLGGKSYE